MQTSLVQVNYVEDQAKLASRGAPNGMSASWSWLRQEVLSRYAHVEGKMQERDVFVTTPSYVAAV